MEDNLKCAAGSPLGDPAGTECGAPDVGQSQDDTFNIGVFGIGTYSVMYLAKRSFPIELNNPEGCTIDPKFDTAIFNFTVQPAVDVIRQDWSDFLLFPNPAQSNITLKLSSITGNTTLYLYNTIGSIVLQQNIQQQTTQVDVSQMPKGIYFAEVQTPQGRAVKKLVVE